MNWLVLVIGYVVFIGLILAFSRGATYKGNIAEDPNYYGEEKND